MSEYLAASIGLADGRVLRIGPDEDQVGDIPTSFSFQTQMPGGFGPASLVIPRPPDLYADDARLFSEVVVYGEGMRIIYEGYVTGIPQQSQDEIQLQITGWSGVLDRIANFRQLFVDRDLSRWGEPSPERRATLGANLNSASIAPSASGTASLVLSAAGPSGENGQTEVWFDAGPGLSIASLFIGNGTGPRATTSFRVGFSDIQNPALTLSDQQATTEVVFPNFTLTASRPRRYAVMRYVNTAGTEFRVRDIAVYGNHNVSLTGPNPKGVYGSEAIAYMVGSTPLTLLPESVEASDFVLPHLSFASDISVRAAIEQINAFGGRERYPNDWGVYDNREFFWRSPGTYGKTWRVRSENLSNVRSDGPDSLLRTAGVKVNYQDEANVTRSVGPPNSFSDLETNSLLSIDVDNPAFRLPGFHTENIGVTSRQGAINVGRVVLNERNRLNWRGDLELQGEVMDSEGKLYPVHRVRAGDQVIVEDDDDIKPRPVNSTTYNHDNLSLTASLGALPDTLDSLLARLAAVTDLIV